MVRMKAWWTILILGSLRYFVASIHTEEFSLVLHLQNGLCMTNVGRNPHADFSVRSRPCDPAAKNQRWYMRNRAIVSSVDGRCLESDKHRSDGTVFATDCTGQTNQQWEFDYLRDHLLGEMQWVRYLQDMKCMKLNNDWVIMEQCLDVAESQFLKLTKWPYSREDPKDVSSSCLDQKCPECPTCSNSDCKSPEWVEYPDILSNFVWPTLPSHTWFMVALALPIALLIVLLLWKGSTHDKPTDVQSKSPVGQSGEKKMDVLEATILHIDSTVTELAAAIDGQIGASDSSSVCTVGSWNHVTSGQPCCFLQDTYFKVVTDDGEIFKPAKMLFKGARVVAADGTMIEVLHPPEQHQVDAVIKLQVGQSSLVVSPDHRILIPGNKTIQAKELEEGSEVFLDGTQAKLTSFEWKVEPTMVLKIAFKPDIPVAAFMCSPSILSKGSRNKPRVRRGTSTRTPAEGGDALTIPDTEPPLTP